MPFHNPYHFVPVEKSERPDDLSRGEFQAGESVTHLHVTHDRYVEETRSGRIICRVISESPIVIGAKQIPDSENTQPTLIEQFELGGWPAIPATSIRGMVSSILEAVSSSALRVLKNDSYSYRKEARVPLKRIGMIMETRDGTFEMVKLARFSPEARTWSNARMVQLPVGHTFETFTLANQRFYYYWDRDGRSPLGEILSEGDWRRLSLNDQRDYVKGFLRIMENSNRADEFRELERKKEVFLLWDPGKDGSFMNRTDNLPISEAAVDNFYLIADGRTAVKAELPYEPVGTIRNLHPDDEKDKRIRLKSGDLVYYGTTGTGKDEVVSEISFSAIWRGKVKEKTNDFFHHIDPDIVPFNTDRNWITMAEQLFGFVEAPGKSEESPKLSLCGRIFPSNAIFHGICQNDGTVQMPLNSDACTDNNDDDPEGTILKTLASPKPPAPAMYFKKKDGGFIPKSELTVKTCTPGGRKFYLHQKPINRPWKTGNEGDGKDRLRMRVKPVKKGAVFFFHIDFHNLSEREFGALVYSLRPAKEFRHKIGLGKPIGLGTIRIDPIGLFLVDRVGRYSRLGLAGPRYTDVWKAASSEFSLIPEYEEEQKAIANLGDAKWNEVRDNFAATIPEAVRSALESIGDPETTGVVPVHYPSSQGNTEQEHFRWFVQNERGSKQTLGEVAKGKIMPLQ